MRIDTELRGVEDVYRVLGQIAPRQATNILRATVGGMASEIQKEAKREAPADKGDLRKGIKVKRRRVRNGQAQADVVVEKSAYYWRFLEYGTEKLSAMPFFLPVVERFRGRALQSFLEQFGRRFEAALARARRR